MAIQTIHAHTATVAETRNATRQPAHSEIRGTASAPSQVTLQTDSLETVASGTVTVTVRKVSFW